MNKYQAALYKLEAELNTPTGESILPELELLRDAAKKARAFDKTEAKITNMLSLNFSNQTYVEALELFLEIMEANLNE